MLLKKVKYLSKKNNLATFEFLKDDVLNVFQFGKGIKNSSFVYGEENSVDNLLQRIYKRLGVSNRNILHMGCEHSDNILFVSQLTNLADNDTKYTHSDGNKPNEYTCDAIITDNPDIVLTCKPADCTVSMIYAEDISGKRYFAFVHAGFKGINLNLPAKVISYMKDNLSIDMSSVKIAITPYIQKEHYIYQSLPDNLPNNASDYISHSSNGGYHIDLGAAIRSQYESSGIEYHQIREYAIDTYEENRSGRIFSHKYCLENNKSQARFLVLGKLI